MGMYRRALRHAERASEIQHADGEPEVARASLLRLAQARVFNCEHVADVIDAMVNEMLWAGSLPNEAMRLPFDTVFVEFPRALWRWEKDEPSYLLWREGNEGDFWLQPFLNRQDPPLFRPQLERASVAGMEDTILQMAGRTFNPHDRGNFGRAPGDDIEDAARLTLRVRAALLLISRCTRPKKPAASFETQERTWPAGYGAPEIRETTITLRPGRDVAQVARHHVATGRKLPLHVCRSHPRTLKDGRQTWVKEHDRGDPAVGVRIANYTVKP